LAAVQLVPATCAGILSVRRQIAQLLVNARLMS
jgi:hypothetical protein